MHDDSDPIAYTAEHVGIVQHPKRGKIEVYGWAEGKLFQSPSPTVDGGSEIDEYTVTVSETNLGKVLWEGDERELTPPAYLNNFLAELWTNQRNQ